MVDIKTQKFIERAKAKHGDKYDYSKTKYTTAVGKVIITCPEHGDFEQQARHHLNGSGCPSCAGNMKGQKDDIVARFRKVHGDKYDYSKVVYKNTNTPVEITCHTHGSFHQTPKSHLRGRGCAKCATAAKKQKTKTVYNTNWFVLQAKKVHGDKYDYSKVDYKTATTKVCITCPEHGDFWQQPNSHIHAKSGCPACKSNCKLTYAQFLRRAKEAHGDKYDYSKVVYKHIKSAVTIICPEHGEFQQTPDKHLMGRGCRHCAKNHPLDTESFIRKSNEVHGDKYDYSKVKYVNASTPVNIICPEHGVFVKTPNQHIHGTPQGCPKCSYASHTSAGEQEVGEFLKSLNVDFITNDRTLIAPYEVDFYIPSLNLAIEYNGMFWHSTVNGKDRMYHRRKTVACRKKGVQLLHIYEDSWLTKTEIWKSVIRNKMNEADRRIAARKTDVVELSPKFTTAFLEANHLQGSCPSSVKYGLLYKDEIVAVMTFGKPRFSTKEFDWELLRFATLRGVQVQGGASKLYKAFRRNYKKGAVLSYANMDFSNGGLYKQLGFKFKGFSAPNYIWHSHDNSYKRYQTQKHKLRKLLGDQFNEEMSEAANMASAGYVQIFDTGNYIYVDTPAGKC